MSRQKFHSANKEKYYRKHRIKFYKIFCFKRKKIQNKLHFKYELVTFVFITIRSDSYNTSSFKNSLYSFVFNFSAITSHIDLKAKRPKMKSKYSGEKSFEVARNINVEDSATGKSAIFITFSSLRRKERSELSTIINSNSNMKEKSQRILK